MTHTTDRCVRMGVTSPKVGPSVPRRARLGSCRHEVRLSSDSNVGQELGLQGAVDGMFSDKEGVS